MVLSLFSSNPSKAEHQRGHKRRDSYRAPTTPLPPDLESSVQQTSATQQRPPPFQLQKSSAEAYSMEDFDTVREDTRFLDASSDEDDIGISSLDGEEEDGNEKGSWISQDLIRDGVIGGSDGLTVPFALTAGLSAFGDTKVVLSGGMAELIAGMISMGIGGWLAAKSEEDYYNHILHRTRRLISHRKSQASYLVRSIFSPYSIPSLSIDPIITQLESGSEESYVQFLMCLKYQLPPPDPYQATKTAITIALGYFIGGMVSLVSYFFVGEKDVMKGLYCSVVIMAIALFLFGWGKIVALQGWRRTSYGKGVWEGVKMMGVGGLAAGCAYWFTRLFDGTPH